MSRPQQYRIRRGLLCLMIIAPALRAASAPNTPTNNPSIQERILEQILVTRDRAAAAAAELNRVRDTITAERLSLAESRDVLESRVVDLKKELQHLRVQHDDRQQMTRDMRSDTKALREELSRIHTVAAEYRRAMETRMGIADVSLLSIPLAEIDRKLADPDDHESIMTGARLLLELASEWNSRKLGGTIGRGTCVDDRSTLVEGNFAVAGPIAYFAAGESSAAGIVVSRPGSRQPSLFSKLSPSALRGIRALTSGSKAIVPIDVTGGNVLRSERERQSLLQHLRRGGIVMIPLLALAAASLFVAAWKFRELARIRTDHDAETGHILALIRADRISEARTAAAGLDEPLCVIILEGIEHRNAPREFLGEILTERIMAYAPILERYLGALAVFGGVAPLLGLLGTVTGMIHTFQRVTLFGTGDAKLLSGGISEALVTTEFGLVIAIPVLLVHAFLSRRVKTIVTALEHTATGFIHSLKPEGQ